MRVLLPIKVIWELYSFVTFYFSPLQVDDISLFLSKLLEQKSCTGVTDHLREWVSGRKSAELFRTVPNRAKGLRVWVPGFGPDSPCYTADVSEVNEAVSVSAFGDCDSCRR